jgi:hypothetical protein
MNSARTAGEPVRFADRFAGVPLIWIVVLCAFMMRALSRSASGEADLDYWWHLEYGRWILNNGRLPVADEWSWTAAGQPYVLTQWGGEVIMALADGVAGPYGTAALSGLIACAILGAVYRACRYYVERPVLALTIAALSTSVFFVLPARPHQWTHLGIALLAYLFARYDVTRDHRAFAVAPLMFIAWVNLHGGYSMGLVVFGLICLFFCAREWIENRRLNYAVATWGIASVLATLVNPHGLGAWRYVIEIGRLKSTTSGLIMEWLPTTITTDIGLHLLLVQMAILFALTLSNRRPQAIEVAFVSILLVAAWSATRVALMLTPLMVPILAKYARETALAQLFRDQSMERIERLSSRWAVGLVGIAIVAAIASMPASKKAAVDYLEGNLPVKESRFLVQSGLTDGRILNDMDAGGYLLAQGVKVSLDGRLDLYGDPPFMRQMVLNKGLAGWESVLDGYKPDVVLTSRMSPMVSILLAAKRFRPVFYGPQYVVMVREGYRTDVSAVPVEDEARRILQKVL